ncbi:nickel-binding protein [Spirosoma sp. 48-14]|nr:nickel-binding protein [Spirosoma sp. 48-14]
MESYVTTDKIYCVYNVPNEELIRQHAVEGVFPANSGSKVSAIIDPTSAE